MLNLFSYSCSLGAAAAAGGAPRSSTWTSRPATWDWGRENFRLSGLPAERARFTRMDSEEYLDWAARKGHGLRRRSSWIRPASRARDLRGEPRPSASRRTISACWPKAAAPARARRPRLRRHQLRRHHGGALPRRGGGGLGRRRAGRRFPSGPSDCRRISIRGPTAARRGLSRRPRARAPTSPWKPRFASGLTSILPQRQDFATSTLGNFSKSRLQPRDFRPGRSRRIRGF